MSKNTYKSKEPATDREIITVTVNGQDIRFAPDEHIYSRYLNELTPDNKVAPAKNFLSRCVIKEDSELIANVVNSAGRSLQVAALLAVEYAGEIDISVKK